MNMRNGKRHRVTLRDIAQKTGYTVNTVSKALRDAPDLADTTRQLIRETAEQMGYVVNNMAGALRSGFTHTLALIVPDISNPFFAIMAKELDLTAREHGYTVIILNTEEDAQREVDNLRLTMSRNVDGVLIFPAQHSTDGLTLLRNAGVPFVLLGRDFDDYEADSVCFDDRRGGLLATRHLLDCHCRRILMLNGPLRISSARNRLAGYQDAMREYGMDGETPLTLTIPTTLGGIAPLLSRAIREDGLVFDSVFAFCDLIAYECVSTLQALGMRVPEDVAVVGFDDIQSDISVPFPLTTIVNDKRQLARDAFSLLQRRISGEWEDYPHKIMLPVQLMARGSCREHQKDMP